MDQLSKFALQWDLIYNGVVIHDPHMGYIVVSVQRILIAYAAWMMLKALARYIALAFPPPLTPENAVYWLRWWLWLRLREFPLLKLGAAATALLPVLQIPTGLGGKINAATLYFLLIYPAMFALLVGVTQLLHHLSDKIQHPSDENGGPSGTNRP